MAEPLPSIEGLRTVFHTAGGRAAVPSGQGYLPGWGPGRSARTMFDGHQRDGAGATGRLLPCTVSAVPLGTPVGTATGRAEDSIPVSPEARMLLAVAALGPVVITGDATTHGRRSIADLTAALDLSA
jgi:hypothetical protein